MVRGAGVDTWSVCWFLQEGSSPLRSIENLATEKASRAALLPEKIAGHRVGWFPGSRMLFAEGHPSEDGLTGAEGLLAAFEQVSEGLADRGLVPPSHRLTRPVGERGDGFGGVRRLDSTVDLRFDRAVDGLAALAGVAALPLPRSKTKIIRESGGRRVETVYFHGHRGKRVLGRWYDKGIQTGEASRGAWVRPEDQRRFGAAGRLPLEVVAESSYVRDAFVRRFEPLWRASKGVKVAGVTELAARLGEMVHAGEVKPSTAKALAGHLVLEAGGVEVQARSTRLGDRARCRDLGLVLADGVLDEVEVDLGAVLEEALDSDAWGAQG